MKKILILVTSLLIITGCGKTSTKNIKDEFVKKVTKTEKYYLKGTMEILNNEDTFKYNIEVSYEDGKNIRVNLENKINEHKQIILKNKEGVYVVTPSLNKSFKFQSDWPDNSSQSYLLHNLKKDINNTSKIVVKEEGNLYSIKADVKYPNNPKLKYEKIKVDKKGVLKEVITYDKDNKEKIRLKVTKIDYKKIFDNDNFKLNSLIDENCCKKEENTNEKQTSATDEITYPLYLPTETYLTAKDVINTDDGNRTILTFTGSKPFILVEEASSINDEFEVIPVYGDPEILNDSVGSLSSSSLSWTSNNKDYYLTSNDLTNEEMITVASSINNSVAVDYEK